MTSSLTVCRNQVFAVAEMHRLGFTHMRAMPFWQAGKWTLILGNGSFFDREFGAFIPPSVRGSCIEVVGSRDNELLGVEDYDPWQIAADTLAMKRRSFGSPGDVNTKYEDWFKSLVVFMAIHPSALPAVSYDGKDRTLWIHHLNLDMSKPRRPVEIFPSPPAGLFDAAAAELVDPEIATAQPRPPDAPSLIWPIRSSLESRLDNWREDNVRGESRELK